MKKKLSHLLSLCLGLLYCFCGCQTESLHFEYKQLRSDFIRAELIYEREKAHPMVYETQYIFTEGEAEQLLTDISQMNFEIYGRPGAFLYDRYAIKLQYTNRTLFFWEHGIGYFDVQGSGSLENYQEYSKYPGYDIYPNEDFMAILNYYISKSEQQN